MSKERLTRTDKLALLMGYDIYDVPGSIIPFYSKRTLTKEEITELDELTELNPDDKSAGFVRYFRGGDLFLDHWDPYIDKIQASQCEEKLVDVGQFNGVNTNYSLSGLIKPGVPTDEKGPNVTFVTFHNSKQNLDISGEGENRLEAVLNACINFIDR